MVYYGTFGVAALR